MQKSKIINDFYMFSNIVTFYKSLHSLNEFKNENILKIFKVNF